MRTCQNSWDSHGGCNGTSKSDWVPRAGPAGLEEARRRFHNQDERDPTTATRGVPVRTTCAIGPIPYSTTPRQLSDALWNRSGGVGTSWKVISLRVFPNKVDQTWLLGAKRPPPATELTLPSGKGLRPGGNDWIKESENRRLGQDQTAKGPAPSRGS